MRIRLRNTEGKVVRSVQVRDDVFDVPMNSALVHQVMVGQLANARQGTGSTKTRSYVSGGGRKPRPQKGSGAARAGTIRAPQWRGGGVAFGPHPRSFRHHTPKRMRRQSLVATLSEKLRQGELVVLESLELGQPKTQELVRVLEALGAGTGVLVVGDGVDAAVVQSARNVPRLKLISAPLLNTLDLLNHRKVIMTLDAVRKAEELWSGALKRPNKQPAAAGAQG